MVDYAVDQMKSLNKARLENQGKNLKNFEVMDLIYQKVRHKTKDSIVKLDPILKSHTSELYYKRKADVYSLLKDMKRKDEANIEKLIEKTQVTENPMKRQEEEIKHLC